MTLRVCSGPQAGERCPTAAITDKPRCPSCRRAYERGRGTRQARGYDSRHDKLRAQYQRRMDAGQGYQCWRCSDPIDPTSWTLGHCDDNRSRYHGPECPPCDYAAAGRSVCPHGSHRAS